MQLTSQEVSAAFWAGAKQGAKRSFGYVALVGVPLLTCMAFGWIPTSIIGFGAAILTGVSTVLTVGMFSGQNALAQYHQQKHNQIYESKLARLEGIAQQNDISLEDHIQHSPRVSTILEQGAKNAGGSFTDAEEQRAAEAPKNHTIH